MFDSVLEFQLNFAQGFCKDTLLTYGRNSHARKGNSYFKRKEKRSFLWYRTFQNRSKVGSICFKLLLENGKIQLALLPNGPSLANIALISCISPNSPLTPEKQNCHLYILRFYLTFNDMPNIWYFREGNT